MRTRNERGVALMTVLVLVVVVGMIVSLAQGRSLRLARNSAVEQGEVRALYAAEGGLAAARHALRTDRQWPGAQLRVGSCQVLVRVERLGEEQWRVRATAVAHPAGQLGNPVQITLIEELGDRYRYRTHPR